MLRWFLGARTINDYIQAGDFSTALEAVDSALEVQSADPELLEFRAQLLAKLGRVDESGEVYLQLADFFAGRGFGMRAIALLKQAQQLTPPQPGIEELIRNVASLAHLDDVAESPLFSMFSRDELITIVQQLRVMMVEPGEILLVQGKPGDSLFVIASGEVRVFAEDENGWPKSVSRILAPAFFGEIAVVRGGARTATVTAASHVAVLELTTAGLEAITTSQPRVREVLVAFADERQAQLDRQGLLKDDGH
jgi:cAMP-dependent protein kinase regulator